MEEQFTMGWKRVTAAVLTVAIITITVSLLAKNYFLNELPGTEGHIHGEAGPFFENLFKIYVPRRACMFHEPGVIWLHFVSDFLIALSYFSIPIALIYFIRRRKDLAFHWMFWMFAAFILLCGTTHIIGMWDLWQPLYKVDGIVKAITGIVSLITAITLWPLIPKALALPSPASLEKLIDERTAELNQANTERLQLLSQERVLRSEAEKSNILKDQFLATLSHELRTPLNSILGWVQILKRKSPDKSIADGLDIIERNSRLQARLIGDLLDMSSILSGKVRLEFKDIDCKDIVTAAVESIKPAAETKKVEVKAHVPDLSVPYTGDPARLEQVLWNLLSNAVKFTPADGIIQIHLKQLSGIVEIKISDSGAGINADFLPFLFDRFTQADSSITRSFGGLGLGLAVSKHLVEMHGGKITAFSEGLKKGSTFTIKLPVMKRAGEKKPSAGLNTNSEKAPNRLKGYKVLAIDDEADNLGLLNFILSEEGAEMFTASSTARAMELLKSKKPDILLCDISMPDEDGYTFIKRVRALPKDEGRDVKAIAVTALATPDEQTKSMLSGFAGHISKPFEHEDLINAIIELLKP